MNRTSYLNNQLNSKRIPLVKTKSSSELAEQTNNLRRLREENNLKNLIKKSLKKNFFYFIQILIIYKLKEVIW